MHINLTTYRAGEGTPLVLVHGFPVDHRMWDATAVALIAATASDPFPILAPDMPGAGDGPLPKPGEAGAIADDTALPQAQDLMAESIVDAVRAAGYDKAVWAGLSMGGYAVLAIQRTCPDAVAGIALLDTKTSGDSDAARARRCAIAHTCETERTVAPVMFFTEPQEGDSPLKRSDWYVRLFTDWIRSQSPDGIAWRERMAAGRPDQHEALALIDTPAAVVCGSLDPSSPPAVMEPIAAQITGAKVTVVEGSGHFTAVEQPSVVTSALLDLVERVRGDAEADAGEARA